MKSTFNTLVLLSILAAFSPSTGLAADKPGAPAKTEPAKSKEKYTALYAQVDAITATELTVKGSGPDLKFVINAETKISKDKAHKEAATVAEVKPGQWIGGSYSKGADGSNVLHSLHLGVNQKGEKPKK